MIDPHFVILGAVIGLIGSGRYAWETVRGRTVPNRVTWFFWAAAPLIGFFAQLDDGVGLPSVLTLAVGLGPALIFMATFANSSSYARLSRFDLGCGAVSAVAVVVWLSLDAPVWAVLLSVIADLVAGLPTIALTYRQPATQHPWVFFGATINAVITLLSIQRWTPATWLFPVYILGLGLTLSVLVTRGRSGQRSSPQFG